MKKTLTVGAVILALGMSLAGSKANASGPYFDGWASLYLTTIYPTLSTTGDWGHKELYVAAQGDALNYLSTGETSELFMEAKATLEAQVNITFADNDEAAKTLYALADTLKNQ